MKHRMCLWKECSSLHFLPRVSYLNIIKSTQFQLILLQLLVNNLLSVITHNIQSSKQSNIVLPKHMSIFISTSFKYPHLDSLLCPQLNAQLQNFIILYQEDIMSYTPTRISISNNILTDRSNRDSISHNQNWESFIVEPTYLNPSIAKSHIIKSKPATKPSFTINTDATSVMNKTMDNIRNNFHATNPCSLREQQENKSTRASLEGNQAFFHSFSINNSTKFTHSPLPDRFTQERRKSESIYVRNTNTLPTFIKKISEVKEPQSKDDIHEIIEQLASRVAITEEEICKLKQKDKKNQALEGEFKEFRGKLLELAKFNSKHFTEYECKLDQQQKALEQIKERLMSFNSNEHCKKTNLLQAKLHQLYQGFKIKENHNQKAIANGINNLQNKIKDHLQTQITNINEKIREKQTSSTCIIAKIQKIQTDLKEMTMFNMNDLHKSNKKSLNCRTIQTKQLIIIRQNQPIKERAKSKFCNSPRKWTYQTPTKQNVDTPIKQLIFQEPTKELVVKQQTYFIDSEGYLLDEDKYYLLDSKNQQILLLPSIIACLKQNNMLFQ